MAPFRSYEHLIRLAALFAAGVALFLVVRWVLVPATTAAWPVSGGCARAEPGSGRLRLRGQVACVECHTDVADLRKTNAHARIGCESCHGPLARACGGSRGCGGGRPDPRTTCAVCHVPSAAKPPWFKTVNFAEHADAGPCTACHPAHAPRL